jgi:hypothetical protein
LRVFAHGAKPAARQRPTLLGLRGTAAGAAAARASAPRGTRNARFAATSRRHCKISCRTPRPSDRLRSFANTCSPQPQIPGRPSAPCVRPSGVPSTWLSPSPRSPMSLCRAATTTTSRRTPTASRCALPLARAGRARCRRGRRAARRQWQTARGARAAPHQRCGDSSSARAGRPGRGEHERQKFPSERAAIWRPAARSGPRRGVRDHDGASSPPELRPPRPAAQPGQQDGALCDPRRSPRLAARRAQAVGRPAPPNPPLTTTSRPNGAARQSKPAASYSPGPLRAKYHRR